MAIKLAEQLEGRHPAFVHRNAGCVDILCHASGESEVPGVAIAKNRDQVQAFLLGQWFGDEGSELDEAMAEFDAHDWDDDPYLEWQFEIGGVKLEQVYEALVEPPVADAKAAWMLALFPPMGGLTECDMGTAMSESHTSGPWTPFIAFVEGEGYSTLFVRQGVVASPADMRLIAKAPDLLAALRGVMAKCACLEFGDRSAFIAAEAALAPFASSPAPSAAPHQGADALREAFTLPPPDCTYADHSYPAYSRKAVERIVRAALTHHQALASPQPEAVAQKAVAPFGWYGESRFGNDFTTNQDTSRRWHANGYRLTPLYTHPAPSASAPLPEQRTETSQ